MGGVLTIRYQNSGVVSYVKIITNKKVTFKITKEYSCFIDRND